MAIFIKLDMKDSDIDLNLLTPIHILIKDIATATSLLLHHQ
jgi:hypothetical protein